jgi:hypothetical protein
VRSSGFHAFVLGLLACCCAVAAHAHGGGLNKAGCHTNRKTGEYHCHRGTAVLPPADSRRSLTEESMPETPSRPYRNCAEARAFGAAPVRRGDPGYGPHLDRDNDGIGCEPYRRR